MLTCFIRALLLYLIIVVALRLMGKRQIGQLEPSELVVAILISEVAAVPMQDLGIPLIYGIIPIVTLLGAEMIFSALCARSLRMRNLLCGRPSIIIREGHLDQQQMERLRLNAAELAEEMRLKGVFDLNTVSCAYLETNGELSIYLKPGDQPLSAAKAGVSTADDPTNYTLLIAQGSLIEQNLRVYGKDEAWLLGKLRENGLSHPHEVFYMTIDSKENLVIIPVEKKAAKPPRQEGEKSA